MEKTPDIAKGIKPEWQNNYREVINDIAFDLTRNVGNVEPGNIEQNTPEQEEAKDKKGILSRLRRSLGEKVTIFILAGLFNLSGPTEESRADQVRMVWQENRIPALFLEESVTTENLISFEEKLRNEEPEVLRWVLEQEIVISRELDNVVDYILTFGDDQGEKQAQIFKESSRVIVSSALHEDLLDYKISENQRIIQVLRTESQKLKDHTLFLKNNLRKIILASMMLDDSKKSREYSVRFNNFANIEFKPYHWANSLGADSAAIPLPEKLWYAHVLKQNKNDLDIPEQLEPEIILTPPVFLSEKDGKIDFGKYINVFIHEYIGHAIHYSSENKSVFLPPFSTMRTVLEEGAAHDVTFQIIQYLRRENDDLKSRAGNSDLYDTRLIYVSLLKAIMATSKNKGVFAEWHSGIISDDELLRILRVNLDMIRLDTTIADDLEKLNLLEEYGEPTTSIDLVVKLLSKLRINGVDISPEFIKTMFNQNHYLDNWQLVNISKLVEYLEIVSSNK